MRAQDLSLVITSVRETRIYCDRVPPSFSSLKILYQHQMAVNHGKEKCTKHGDCVISKLIHLYVLYQSDQTVHLEVGLTLAQV